MSNRLEQIMNHLKQASLHEMFRLCIYLNNEMEDPHRIRLVREQFKKGDDVSYFSTTLNRTIEATVISKSTKTVLVQPKNNFEPPWRIPYAALQIAPIHLPQDNKAAKITRNTLSVGEWVGFNHDGVEIIGVVKRLNPKTASIVSKEHGRWRVTYRSLYRVLEGEHRHQGQVIELSAIDP